MLKLTFIKNYFFGDKKETQTEPRHNSSLEIVMK